jgi:pimeloyl-ACP methyl ester carboxylesterase
MLERVNHAAVVESFAPTIDPAVIDDLRRRLAATRWADAPVDAGWSLGVDVDELRGLMEYWADGFDFAAHQAVLDALPSRRVRIGGVGIHVVHARSTDGAASGAMPVLLAHGWPDSAWRYRKLVPLLTDPGRHGGDPLDAVDVVVPDMPGFGFSDRPAGAPLDSRAVAGLWAELMTALGYDRFAVSGGDMGSHVARYLALDHPDRVLAAHRTDAGVPVFDGDPADLTPEERDWLAECSRWAAQEGAYIAMQRTKPQTVAVGLADSPAGLAAWVVEKLRSWSDCAGDLWSAYTRDEVLWLLTEHWATGTFGASMRMYRANAAIPREQLTRRVEVPSGFSLFAGDMLTPPRAWLERTTNLVSVSRPERGGHFAAFEQPARYAEELTAFLRPFRDRHGAHD